MPGCVTALLKAQILVQALEENNLRAQCELGSKGLGLLCFFDKLGRLPAMGCVF